MHENEGHFIRTHLQGFLISNNEKVNGGGLHSLSASFVPNPLGQRDWARYFHMHYLVSSPQHYLEICIIASPILQMTKLRLNKVEYLIILKL